MSGPDGAIAEAAVEAPPADRAPAPAPARPTITITFEGPGSANCTIVNGEGVTPAQVYAAAWLLEAGAREIRARQVELDRVNSLALARSLQGLGRGPGS